MKRHQIRDASQLASALASEGYLLFKHSGRCPVSAHAFSEYRAFVLEHPEIRHGWIDVVDDRALSLEAASKTDVTHASPQALWIVAGSVSWHASHFEITQSALEKAARA